jgi:hypothetical protein
MRATVASALIAVLAGCGNSSDAPAVECAGCDTGGVGGSAGGAGSPDPGQIPEGGAADVSAVDDSGDASAIVDDAIAEEAPYVHPLPWPVPMPAGMPAHLAVGIGNGVYKSNWMASSGVPWDFGYQYFTTGWPSWEGHTNGWVATDFFGQMDAVGAVPTVVYYALYSLPGGGQDETYTKLTNVATMRTYFGELKTMMERARDFDKPVLIVVEPDGFGFLELQTKDNFQSPAQIAATGMPELAALPDTVAGWGLSFLEMRKQVGASKVVLGMVVSAWANSGDVASYGGNNLAKAVAGAYKFLAPLGLLPNVTGATYDLIVGDPLDRDADYYRVTQSQNRWWDASDTAALDVPSFNRYAEWLRLWNTTARKRWALWQIPCGNSASPNACNGGYKDNRPEYFFAPDADGGYPAAAAHRAKYADAGVVALLFGHGAGCQTTYMNDPWPTRSSPLLLKTHAGVYLKSPLAVP